MKPGHVHSISLFSDIVIVYTLPALPGTLYVLMGGNTKGLRLASKSSRTRLLAHSLRFIIYEETSSGEKFWAGEILDFDSVYTSCITIVSLSLPWLLDCPFGIPKDLLYEPIHHFIS